MARRMLFFSQKKFRSDATNGDSGSRPLWRAGLTMTKRERRAAYVNLWLLALALGWIEASVVVYLREIAVRESAINATSYLPNLQVSLVALPGILVAMESAREVCTLVLLGAVGWLAGRRAADRLGAFLMAFGVWDIAYYAVLRLVSGWPESVSTWDILFRVPSPWVAPVWAPVTIATLFVVGGSYLFWTADRERRYRAMDVAMLLASAGLALSAFLAGSNAVIDHRLPEHFPVWVFWSGVILGIACFAAIERREIAVTEKKGPWVGVRVRTLAPTHADLPSTRSGIAIGEEAIVERREERDVGDIVSQYREAKNRLDGLVSEAGEFAERFDRLAHWLSTRRRHQIVSLPDEDLGKASEREIAPSRPLPSIEELIALSDTIRAEGTRVEELRERLILMGHADLAAEPNEFFH